MRKFAKKKPEIVLFTDGWMGWDGRSKVSFNFVYILWVYRACILYLYIYTLIVQIKTTANKGDVFMIGSFLGEGGYQKK